MKTHISKLILTFLTLLGVWTSQATSLATMSNPDVRVFVTLPSNPGTNDGIIDLMINAGTVPYYIKYFKQNNSGTYIIAHEVKSSNTGDEDFLNAGVGTYRIEIADAHCAFLSLDVVVSFDCNCPLPVLYYNDAGCYLHWNPECQNGYSYTLEKLSGITWAEIQTQNAQHPIQSNGSFRLKFSRPGCNTQYSDVVATACLMPPSCMCTPPLLSYIAASCTISWSNTTSCQGFVTSLQHLNASNIWENISGVTSPYTLTENGNYRLMYSKTECLPVLSNVVSVSCVQTNTVSQGSLIINEFSQGCQGVEEYIELIVTGSTPFVTVEGMIIDDNNHSIFEQGNESGHIRLGSCFSYVPVGSIILIYNGSNANPSINTGSNGSPGTSGVYQMPVNDPCILHYPSCPDNHSGRTDYNCSPGASGGWSDLIPLYNLRDVVQVRNSSGQLVEAVVYGGAQFVGTGGNVITIPNSSNLTMFRRASHTTWTATDPCSNSRPTPGLANDLVNDTFIKELSHVDVSSLYLLPNPANTIINIVSDKDIETIVLMDITGKIVLTHQNNSDKSSQLNIESFNEGVHLVKVKYTDNSEEFKKFIKINK